MKYIILSALLYMPSLGLYAQDTPPAPPPIEKGSSVVEIEATFPGGVEGWKKYLMANLDANIPVEMGAPAGRYTVIVEFTVDKNGVVSNIKPLTKHGFGMEEQVVKLIEKSGNWIPAQQNGNYVHALRKQPVTFQVVEEKKKRRKG